MIVIDKKENCCGCTACANICPKDAIEMVRDNEGFSYPKINKEKCIECGLCQKICPILNKKANETFKQKGYIFQHNHDGVRKQSTSGGAFTAIAEYVIENNGIVFGVGFDNEFKVKHQDAKTKEELEKFRNSKYVQSDPNTTFAQVKKHLKEGILVCYSGTACQIEGLKSYLQEDFDNLITVDVICRAVPSPLLWEKYFKYRTENKKNIKKAYFREKYYGYKYSNLTIYDEKENIYHAGVETDPYLRAFFSNICDRPSCYTCKFKEKIHKADFTIWDCFEVENFDKTFDDDKGTTRILLNSNKAIDVFEKIKDKHRVKEVEVEELTKNVYQLEHCVKLPENRKQFFKDLNEMELDKLMAKYFPNTIKCKIEKYARLSLIKIGIYKPLLKIGKKFRSRN